MSIIAKIWGFQQRRLKPNAIPTRFFRPTNGESNRSTPPCKKDVWIAPATNSKCNVLVIILDTYFHIIILDSIWNLIYKHNFRRCGCLPVQYNWVAWSWTFVWATYKWNKPDMHHNSMMHDHLSIYIVLN